jgi:hypothetical protein
MNTVNKHSVNYFETRTCLDEHKDEIRMAALLDQHNRIALAIIRDGNRFGLDHLSRVNRRRRLELREEVK